MFSWTRSQNRPSDPPVAPARPRDPGGFHVAAAVAEPVVEAPVAPEPEGPPPARRLTDAECETRLGGLRIRGTLTGSDSVELAGTFDGPINVEGLCRVNAGGHVTGDLTAGDAVIAGDLQGRLTVIGRLELGAHARVVADIEAGTIAIAEGCFIEGRIHMRGSEGGSQPTSFKEKRKKRRKGHGHAKPVLSTATQATATPATAVPATAAPEVHASDVASPSEPTSPLPDSASASTAPVPTAAPHVAPTAGNTTEAATKV
jgi:cytoskeletal protein CcmA (bactofilin family)